ncbi:MAG: glycosyltransferase [Ignavibacteriae bacterium]|nr:glycosyltransferase [Ignavibacteriota bacterium]
MSHTSLIISVYKNTKALELIFYALSKQSYKDFEIIIAEDGEYEGISEIIEKSKSYLNNPIIHITQEDKGFRKNRILNEAIRKSNTDYLIFIDGDCVPHSDFIKEHVENREDNTVLCGRRVALGKEMSERITKESILSGDYQKIGLKHFVDSMKGSGEGSKHVEEGLRFSARVFGKDDEHILGCNFSIQKSLLEKINGFDENYEGPGLGEDSDIEFRLRLIDVKFKSVRNKAIQYHLFHPRTKEDERNFEYFQEVKKKGEYFCENGLSKHHA